MERSVLRAMLLCMGLLVGLWAHATGAELRDSVAAIPRGDGAEAASAGVDTVDSVRGGSARVELESAEGRRLGSSEVVEIVDGKVQSKAVCGFGPLCSSWFACRDFRVHWSGLELGVNAWFDGGHGISLAGEYAPYRLSVAKSLVTNLNFLQYSVPFGTRHFGMGFGMGTSWNVYRLEDGLSLRQANGVVESWTGDCAAAVKCARLMVWRLTVPLLLEFQVDVLGQSGQKFYIGCGAIGQLRMLSKMTTWQYGNREMVDYDSYYVRNFSYSLTARMGYGRFRLFASYYPLSLFESGRAPTLYPFEVGLSLVSF